MLPKNENVSSTNIVKHIIFTIINNINLLKLIKIILTEYNII